jgi:hypothetical protein
MVNIIKKPTTPLVCQMAFAEAEPQPTKSQPVQVRVNGEVKTVNCEVLN